MATLEQAVSKLFCIGFPGIDLPRGARALLERGVTGVILFARNFESAEQFARLLAKIKGAVDRPLLTSIDQEGGRVRRLRGAPFTSIPPMRALGRLGDENVAREVGRVLARELRAVNVDLDFAPVLDVDTNSANPVIGDRSFSSDPEVVARLGAALIDGLQTEGVAACAKHFPGHGDTHQDSHRDLPRLPHDIQRLEAVELLPFRRVAPQVASIMTAHVVFERIDPERPATMSRPALDGILRDRWAYEGVVISDDLEMKAIADHFSIEEAVVEGVMAGVDLFLVCHHEEVQARAVEALVAAVRRGRVPEARIAEAGRRIDRLVARFVRPPVDAEALAVLGCDAHRRALAPLEPYVSLPPTGTDPTAA